MATKIWDVIVVGGGAAGFFAAIEASKSGENQVLLLEKTNKLLSKVKVSGGGRCNVTHHCDYASELIQHYPRGGKSLRKGFEKFGCKETRKWFENRKVPLKVEADGRVFPKSDSSQSIISCLMDEASKNDVQLKLQSEVAAVTNNGTNFLVKLTSGESLQSQKIIICSGGHPKSAAYQWISKLGVNISQPIPSLFTFKVPDSDYKDLMGLSVPNAWVQIPGTKWKQDGPLLITHWGFSAPAVIKLSAWAAIDLHLRSYQFPILINWCRETEEAVKGALEEFKKQHPKKLVKKQALFAIPSRLWERIANEAGIIEEQRFVDISKKNLNKLVEMLVRHPFKVNGKTTFKEEFVTCGGVDLNEVHLQTFECKKTEGLYFAGEVLNVDGVTGGFNFQHAWTSGYLSGKSAADSLAK